MAFYRANIQFQADSALPRDAMSINPHFSGDQPQALADALKTNLVGHVSIGATKAFRIRIYDAEKSPPSYPLAEATSGTGFFATTHPRELGLCLSYYSSWNRPRYRGRLYLPIWLLGGGTGLRPTPGQMTIALDFRQMFTNGLPPAHNWIVYSPTNSDGYGVTDCWVDDEWDIQRSRGLKGTTRQTAEVP